LLLRINNILRRLPSEKNKSSELKLGDFVFDLKTGELKDKHSEIVHITPLEQTLLSILGKKIGQIFSRDNLAELLQTGENSRSIDVQITRLRKKIEKDSKNPRYLQTIRGKGYMLLTD